MQNDRKLLGKIAEDLAAQLYEKAGFEILERNYRHGAYEIDLIAKRGRVIHLIEVKYRATLLDANFALSQAQFARIGKAGEAFMQDREELLQIDAFLVDHKLQWERIDNIMLV